MTVSEVSSRETVLQFGRFQFHPHKRLLMQGDRPVRIGSRALDILQVLIRLPGEIIAKEAIIAQVWGGTVVEEINLRVHIAALRRALGEGRTGERYIANVPLRGYGFVGVVEPLDPQVLPALPVSGAFNHLPLSLSSLVGRDELIRRLVALLPRQRLLTLAGPGGMGKTCVAIRVAEQLAGHYAGVAFVDLAAEAGDCDLDSAIAQALGPLGNAPELLLLDNCEHRADACAEAVERWLRLRPSLTILATSREPLRAEAEQVVRLPPLELPRPGEACLAQALACSAVQLFLLRAREVCDRFEMRPTQLGIIVRVCRALDGIPLAIEMAARQVPTLGLAGLPVLLERPLQLVMPGRRTAPARHQSLRATYDWSFDLLSGNELRCLNLLAGLGSTFSLEGATLALRELRLCRGCVFDALRQLVEKSLLQVEADDLAVRYRLPYTARACLLEREPLSRVGVAIPAA